MTNWGSDIPIHVSFIKKLCTLRIMDGWLPTWYIHVCTVKSLCFNKRHQPKNFFILLLRMIIIISILIVVMALSLCKKGTEGCSCIYNGKGTVAEEELWRYKYQSAHFPFFLSSHWKQKALFEMNKTNIPSPYPSHVTIHALTVSTFHYLKIFLRKYFPIKRFFHYIYRTTRFLSCVT